MRDFGPCGPQARWAAESDRVKIPRDSKRMCSSGELLMGEKCLSGRLEMDGETPNAHPRTPKRWWLNAYTGSRGKSVLLPQGRRWGTV